MPGRIVVVATPIGNLGDLSPRASIALKEADFWLVEDTRVSSKLQSVLEIKKRMRVLNEHSRPDQINDFLNQIEVGESAALLTDAGTPAISDPGAQLVDGAYARGIEVDSIPGPSAVTDALALSGFFAQRFAFLGFLGRKPGDIREVVSPFIDSTFTLVLFESPHRFLKTLEVISNLMGERRYAICRELTKSHQQVYRGTFPHLPASTEVLAKGEFTLVIEGKRRKTTSNDAG